ncbi:MAG: glycosyltransferase family 39 protein, partial [Chloroflexota bacterium]|nr:glycosyltransferase family 39 protein [Chloroflexota bacterium]
MNAIFASLQARWRALDPAWRFSIGIFLAARIGLSAWAFAVSALIPLAVSNLELHGEPVVTAFDLRTSARAVFSRTVDGSVLAFRAGDAGFVTDAQTASVWSLSDGRALAGKYSGSALTASVYSAEDVFPYRGVAEETNPLLSVWQRFDANWYVAIAERGYGSISGDVHFPPLYPALIRVVGSLMGDYFFAAFLISNLATIAMLVVLYQVVRDCFDASVATRAVAFLLIFPTAFFFFSAYTESLFLLVALLALRSMQKHQWLRSGFWVFCAILIRLQGIALFVPLAYTLWTARPIDQKLTRVVSLALPAGAMVLYLFIRAVGGDAAVIPTSELSLFARLVPPWENYVYALQTFASGHFTAADILNFVITTLFLVFLVVGWRKLPIVYGLFAVTSVIVLTMRLVDTQPLNSMSRYALTLFPIFIL